MNRGGARKGAGRKPTGKTRAPETFSLRLSTLSALYVSVPGGRRSSFVDTAICEALDKLINPPNNVSRGTNVAQTVTVPQIIAPKPFETI